MESWQTCYNASMPSKVLTNSILLKAFGFLGFIVCWAFLILSLLSCSVGTKAQAKQTPQRSVSQPAKSNELDKTLDRYMKAKSVHMDVKKEMKLALLDRTEKSEGYIKFLGKENVRLEYITPTKSIAVIKGQQGFVVDYPPKDVEDVVRVLKFSWNKRDKNKFLLASLLTKGTLKSSFHVMKKSVEEDISVFQLKPIKKTEDIVDLTISVRDQMIIELSYLDPLGNKTTFQFSNIEFDKEVSVSEFDLKVPKGAEVTQM